MSSIQGLNTLLTALRAHQQALFTTAHNIANANSAGYSRQVAAMEGIPSLGGWQADQQIGQGVQISTIERIRNAFFDQQFRNENQSLGYYTARGDALDQLQTIIHEPTDSGIRSALQGFWHAWHDLNIQPETTAARAAVQQSANAVADAIRHQASQLSALRSSLDQTVVTRANEINTISDELAALNVQIVASGNQGNSANDLLDKRDVLLDSLTHLASVQITHQSNGAIGVGIGGGLLVDSATAYHITFGSGAGGTTALNWSYNGSPVNVAGGELGGLLYARDTTVPTYQAQLEVFTSALVTNVNSQHAAGYGLDGSTGNLFWDPTSTAASLRLDAGVAANSNKIAAASTNGNPGDGSNATAIADVERKPVISGATLEDYFRSIIGAVGIDAQGVQRGQRTEESLIAQLKNLRDSSSGVSLDEEMTNMVRYQQGYQAAARMVTTLDGMLDTVVNRMGVR